MRTVKCDSFTDAKGKLQDYVDGNWHDYPGCTAENKRRWLQATPPDSYNDSDYRVELWILEGSPVKLIAVLNHYKKEIICFNHLMEKQAKFSWLGEEHG